MKISFMVKNFFVLSLIFLNTNSHAGRNFEEYLNETTRTSRPSIMVIGEGDIYDRSFYSVNANESVSPDLVDDVTTQVGLSQLPRECFDRILLYNIPTSAFNSSYEDGIERDEEGKPLTIFRGLARLLKSGGTLEFNNMWGMVIVSPEAQAQILALISSGQRNPFNKYVTHEDLTHLNGRRFHQTDVYQAYRHQLESFFHGFGFSRIEFTPLNPREVLPPKPWNSSTYRTPTDWWTITKDTE